MEKNRRLQEIQESIIFQEENKKIIDEYKKLHPHIHKGSHLKLICKGKLYFETDKQMYDRLEKWARWTKEK